MTQPRGLNQGAIEGSGARESLYSDFSFQILWLQRLFYDGNRKGEGVGGRGGGKGCSLEPPSVVRWRDSVPYGGTLVPDYILSY